MEVYYIEKIFAFSENMETGELPLSEGHTGFCEVPFITIKLSIVYFLETETLVPYHGGKAFLFLVVKTNIFLNLMAMGGETKRRYRCQKATT